MRICTYLYIYIYTHTHVYELNVEIEALDPVVLRVFVSRCNILDSETGVGLGLLGHM